MCKPKSRGGAETSFHPPPPWKVGGGKHSRGPPPFLRLCIVVVCLINLERPGGGGHLQLQFVANWYIFGIHVKPPKQKALQKFLEYGTK